MDTTTCFLVEKDEAGLITRGVQTISQDRLGQDAVTIRVRWSSLNYKDGLAATGHSGIVRRFPHVPGIDAAGEVVSSTDTSLHVGQQVIVTSFDLGAGHWGGWSQFIRVPAEWVVPLPAGLSLRDSMILGTAGLTAAMSVSVLQHQGVEPSSGEILVTGATGGVGCLAVKLLAKLGYRVVASTGKPACESILMGWGASRVISRNDLVENSQRPLLSARWAGAIDTVGGKTLHTILRELQNGGCVAACGLVGGSDLNTTVYPFLLRGVTLVGIESATYPMAKRRAIWQKFASSWQPKSLGEVVTEISMPELGTHIDRILRGEVVGRVVVRVD